jgi:hypothetical protein
LWLNDKAFLIFILSNNLKHEVTHALNPGILSKIPV